MKKKLVINSILSKGDIRRNKFRHSPLKYQVMFGAGAPSALHEMVASFPSQAVKFWGGFTKTGDDAGK